MFGFACFMVSTRLRRVDAQRVLDEPFLGAMEPGDGFVEVSLGRTKMTHKPKASDVEKAAVGHAVGIMGHKWAESWLALRKQQ